MLNNLKNIFKNSSKENNKILDKKPIYTLSKDIDNIGYDTYDTISKAIEATKGKDYFIHETTADKTLCKGRWVEYILQKNS